MRDWLVQIQRSEQSSLQMQIREALVSAILENRLSRDEPVPSTRKMAKTLKVSRNTVVLAYQGLMDDGFLVARERSGFYVSDKPLLTPTKPGDAPRPPRPAASSVDWQKHFQKHPAAQENITKPLNWQNYAYPFIYGQVDHTLFPVAEWRDCMRQALGRRWLGTWTNDAREHDDPLLVEHIRRRILPRRGILAEDSDILITLGAQNALYLLSSLLIGRATRVAMEEPGYPDVRNIFNLHSDTVSLVPVDSGGMTITPEVKAADVIFLTPSHQFPTTVNMPIERRKALLTIARANNSIIIEDDYEFETNYVNEPCPALKSLDEAGSVIYVGSLSKSLFPGLRLGFMVGPSALVAEARALRRLMVRHAPNTNQRAAALFLSLGHHDTLVRRLHRAYHSRWEIMGKVLAECFPEQAQVPSFGGTSFWIGAPPHVDTELLALRAAESGILIEPGRVHFGRPSPPRNFFRLAFSSIDESRIEPGVRLLARIMKEM